MMYFWTNFIRRKCSDEYTYYFCIHSNCIIISFRHICKHGVLEKLMREALEQNVGSSHVNIINDTELIELNPESMYYSAYLTNHFAEYYSKKSETHQNNIESETEIKSELIEINPESIYYTKKSEIYPKNTESETEIKSELIELNPETIYYTKKSETHQNNVELETEIKNEPIENTETSEQIDIIEDWRPQVKTENEEEEEIASIEEIIDPPSGTKTNKEIQKHETKICRPLLKCNYGGCNYSTRDHSQLNTHQKFHSSGNNLSGKILISLKSRAIRLPL